jgi:hypothetical protein
MKEYSFDVFASCLTRTYLRPAELHYELAKRMLTASRGTESVPDEAVFELVELRESAGRLAQSSTPASELGLSGVYGRMAELDAWGIAPEEMLELELELEREAVRPVAATRRQITEVRSSGARIRFTVSSHLPADLIRSMLLEHGIAEPEDLFCCGTGSAELIGRQLPQCELATGATTLAAPPNYPRRLPDRHGPAAVRGRRIVGRLSPATRMNRYEMALAARASAPGDTAATLAALSRATRLACDDRSEGEWLSTVTEIAANVIAPLLTSFVSWTLAEASRLGLERLYFVARDGQILHRIASELATADTPELRYLHGSRQAWYLPSINSLEPQELEFLVLNGQSSAPRHNLRRLGLEPERISEMLEQFGFPGTSWEEQLRSAESGRRFLNAVRTPEVTGLIVANARRAREVTLRYFEQEGLMRDTRWALVDVGWTLRTQAALRKTLLGAGQPYVRAFYLGVTRRRFSAPHYGHAHAYLLEDREAQSPIGKAIFENKGLIDQVFTMADHGSTRGYEERGDRVEPILAPLREDDRRRAFRTQVLRTVVRFANEVRGTALLEGASEFRDCARLVTHLLLARPTQEEAAALAWAPISDDPNELRTAPLARRLDVLTLSRIARDLVRRARREGEGSRTVPRLFFKDLSWGFSWLEGSVALSGPHARLGLSVFRGIQALRAGR